MKESELEFNHSSLVQKIRLYYEDQNKKIRVPEKKFEIKEFLDEYPEIQNSCRKDIFRWEEIPGKDENRLKDYLKEKFNVSGIDKSAFKKEPKKISIKIEQNAIILILDEEREVVTLKFNSEKSSDLVLRKEKGKMTVYQYEYDYSLDSNLPIDLIIRNTLLNKKSTKKPQAKHYFYFLFFVASTKELPKSLERAMQFYKFYLSGIVESDKFEIILVPSENTIINSGNKKFLRDNGFGLWTFKKSSSIPRIEIEPITNSALINNIIQKVFDKYPVFPESKKIVANLSKTINSSNEYTVHSLVGAKLEQFGKSYIDRYLMNKIFNLKKISYRDKLLEYITQQLTEKSDEYEFANEVFSQLWSTNIGLKYTEFLKKFEPSLQYLFAETREKNDPIYRDHYLHQFQVFLLGLPIIDNYYDDFCKYYDSPEICWLIASSFHDIAYPVEMYHHWIKSCFDMVCKIEQDPIELKLKSQFIDEKILASMGYLICEYCKIYEKNPELKHNWLMEKDAIIQFFYQKISREKNHGLMSSISLLKMIQINANKKKIINKFKEKPDPFDYALKKIFMPSSLAIALHDKKAWKMIEKKKEWPLISEIQFEDDPLTFLLIYCDAVQEWGRPSKAEEKEEINKGMKFYLHDYIFKDKIVKIILKTPDCEKTEDFFTNKQKELKNIAQFLKEPKSISFKIHLSDKNNDGEDFAMKGPKSRS
jgi:hypothetical protein